MDRYFSRRDVMTAAATLVAAAPAHALMAKEEVMRAPARERGAETVKGIVFESRSGARERRPGDPGIPGVLVSNGRDVVRTDADGRYSLPIEDGMAVFVIKPTDYAVPLDEETRLPRFYYIHQPEGTPAGLDLLY